MKEKIVQHQEWVTMNAYAKSAGVARSTITRAVRSGRLETNGKSGRDLRVRGELAPASKIQPSGVASFAPADLTEARLEKLKRDIALADQRLESRRDAERREWCEKLADLLIRRLSGFRAGLASLGLGQESLDSLGHLLDVALSEFEEDVAAWLDGRLKEE